MNIGKTQGISLAVASLRRSVQGERVVAMQSGSILFLTTNNAAEPMSDNLTVR